MSQARAPMTQGTESARQVVAFGLAVALTVVALDFVLVGRLSLFFDLCFVSLCLLLAVRVAPGGFYTVGVLPPLLMLAVFLLLAAVAPEVVAEQDDGVVQAVVSGLAHHSGALIAGYALCLGALEYRRRRLHVEF